MNRLIRNFSFLILGALLVSCAFQPRTLQSKPTAFFLCKAGCDLTLRQCQDTCEDSCTFCRGMSDVSTKKRYNRYKREQCTQGFQTIRILNSYRDPLRCRKVTCDCSVDYKVCLQSCKIADHVGYGSFK